MLLTHEDLDLAGAWDYEHAVLRSLIGDAPFDVRAAVKAYLSGGNAWQDIPRIYGALVASGRLPESDLAWRIARMPFQDAGSMAGSEALGVYGDTLGPDNWQAAAELADRTTSAIWVANSARAAAMATSARGNRSVALCYGDVADDATTMGGIAATGNYVRAYQERVRIILDMVLNEIEQG